MNIQRSDIPSCKFRDIENGQKFIKDYVSCQKIYCKTGEFTAYDLDNGEEYPIAPFWKVKPIRITDILYEKV
jgi:hypothetical protein